MLAEIVFERFAFNKTHNQIPALIFLKMVKDAGEIGMMQVGKHHGFLPESIGRFLLLLVI
ncbi:MAG TPA: hypothetical protein VFV38_31575 [Ktedonobacteraceae bacterium]|nr:hypothetical protein [Ktedonobacteraceae bacterium]